MEAWTKEYFRQQYDAYSGLVYRICMLYLKNESDAKDGVQDIFLKAWAKQPAFQDTDHEKAWFIQTSKHYCLDVLKSCWRKKRTIFELDEEIPCEDRKEESILLENVMHLPQKFREVIYLYYYEEYSVKEISSLLRRKESTIQSQLAAGRKKLKNLLAPEGGNL